MLEKNAIDTTLDPRISQAILELRLLIEYTEVFNCTPHRIVFDPALARGLDYYTGTIYEIVIKGNIYNLKIIPLNN